MCLPDLWIAGPPKCGTSSLFRWLGDHPEVTPSAVKEPFYLLDPASPFHRPDRSYQRQGADGYCQFFPEPSPPTRHRLEATTHTLFQQTAREVLARQTPQPRVIVVLRKPSARVYSSFRFTQHNLAKVDPELSFARFQELLAAGDDAELRRRVYLERSLYVLRRDVAYSRYLEHLEPWAEALVPGHLHVLVMETLMSDPRRQLESLAKALGLDPGFYRDYAFPRINETFRVRSHRTHRLARALRPLVPRNRWTLGLYRAYLRWQRRPGASDTSAEDRQAIRRLDDYYRPYNERLAKRFGLDLEPWETP